MKPFQQVGIVARWQDMVTMLLGRRRWEWSGCGDGMVGAEIHVPQLGGVMSGNREKELVVTMNESVGGSEGHGASVVA